MKNIIIVGYPKSGNTWVTRLVAELVECKVAGFWASEHDEIAIEGGDRSSDWQCYKSHHQLHELYADGVTAEDKIIYLVRDPRDVIVSAANYFLIDRWPKLAKIFDKVPKGKSLYRIISHSEKLQIKHMINTVLYGSERVHYWFRVPWKDHCMAYVKQHFFLKYEDLLCQPQQECNRILSFLNLSRTDAEISRAIERQSFKRKKEQLLLNGEKGKAHFMRSGAQGEWQRKLSRQQQLLFVNELSEELTYFGYSLDAFG